MFTYDFLGDGNAFPTNGGSDQQLHGIHMQWAVFDEIYLDSDTETTPDTTIPAWGYTTILDAKFNNNLLAGNIDVSFDTISSIKIKRREKDNFDWITITELPIHTTSDLNFFVVDNLVASNTTYEYAVVPMVSGAEGSYQILEIKVDFDGAFIIDTTGWHQLYVNFMINNVTRQLPSAVVETANSKYPYIFYNKSKCYDTISINCQFVDKKSDSCTIDLNNITTYRTQVRNYLSNQNVKILKTHDGQMWMGCVTDAVSEAYGGYYKDVSTSFNFTETGDATSETDLYENGFLDALEVMT